MLQLLLLSLAVLCVGGIAALLSRRPSQSDLLGTGAVILASIIGAIPVVFTMATGQVQRFDMSWNIPYGSFAVGIDPLSAVFLLPLFILAALAAVYAVPYMHGHQEGNSRGVHWLFLTLMIAAMILVFTARNGMLFLIAWEGMAITSFFLVTLDNRRKEVRDAGWLYLVIAHMGTAFLLAAFGLMLTHSGSLDFDSLPVLAAAGPASGLFLLTLLGFGAKAGLIPLHVWLPEAHPVAPSHISALMSGILIKTGIYGVLRMLTFLGTPPTGWGTTLVVVGLTTGILGVLFALPQKDLKRLLAYSSIENIGIVTTGIGVGVWGMGQGSQLIAVLGFSAALLHVLNHAVCKGLLFLAAGAVLHATGTTAIDRLGGLAKTMPITTALFALGAAAIIGLPPLSGFISEFLLLSGALTGATEIPDAAIVPIVAFVGMAIIGGLAAAVFAKAFGLAFLGAARTKDALHAEEAPRLMQLPMVVLAAMVVLVGLAAPAGLVVVLPAAAHLAQVPLDTAWGLIGPTVAALWNVALVAFLFVVLVGALALLRRALLAHREVGATVTWDCGYERPTARMQYTSYAFAQPLVDAFRIVIRPRRYVSVLASYFPGRAAFAEEVGDVLITSVYSPALGWIEWASARLRMLQRGRVHLYLLYIFLTLMALLVWGLGFQR